MFFSIFLAFSFISSLALVYICYKHFRAMRRLDFYRKQGIPIAPGHNTFFIGNGLDIVQFLKDKKTGRKTKPPFWYHMSQFAKSQGD